jgi:hypothetical protein
MNIVEKPSSLTFPSCPKKHSIIKNIKKICPRNDV